MSIENKTVNEMFKDTTLLVSQAFYNIEPVSKIYLNIGDGGEIENKFALGVVKQNDDNEVAIRLGVDELYSFFEELGVSEQNIKPAQAYIGVSMYAGFLIVKNMLSGTYSTTSSRDILEKN